MSDKLKSDNKTENETHNKTPSSASSDTPGDEPEPHSIGDSHHPHYIGVAVTEEFVDSTPLFEWVVLPPRVIFHRRAKYTLTREFNGKVLQSVEAEGFNNAIKALRPLAIEDETVVWLCTCACSDETHDMIHLALAGTRLAGWEPKH